MLMRMISSLWLFFSLTFAYHKLQIVRKFASELSGAAVRNTFQAWWSLSRLNIESTSKTERAIALTNCNLDIFFLSLAQISISKSTAQQEMILMRVRQNYRVTERTLATDYWIAMCSKIYMQLHPV